MNNKFLNIRKELANYQFLGQSFPFGIFARALESDEAKNSANCSFAIGVVESQLCFISSCAFLAVALNTRYSFDPLRRDANIAFAAAGLFLALSALVAIDAAIRYSQNGKDVKEAGKEAFNDLLCFEALIPVSWPYIVFGAIQSKVCKSVSVNEHEMCSSAGYKSAFNANIAQVILLEGGDTHISPSAQAPRRQSISCASAGETEAKGMKSKRSVSADTQRRNESPASSDSNIVHLNDEGADAPLSALTTDEASAQCLEQKEATALV